jgi:hypothetical protein
MGTTASTAQTNGLDPASAETLLKADMLNLTRKVKAGRPLSPGERKLLSSVAGGGPAVASAYVRTQVELAKAIGVERKTVARWRKIQGNPGCEADGRWNVAAWRAFKASRAGENDGDGVDSVTTLKARHILLQNQKLEHQIAVMRREYVPAAEVERWGAELGAAIRKVVRQIHQAAPSVVGMQVEDAEARLREIEDEIVSQLHLLDDASESYAPREVEA